MWLFPRRLVPDVSGWIPRWVEIFNVFFFSHWYFTYLSIYFHILLSACSSFLLYKSKRVLYWIHAIDIDAYTQVVTFYSYIEVIPDGNDNERSVKRSQFCVTLSRSEHACIAICFFVINKIKWFRH